MKRYNITEDKIVTVPSTLKVGGVTKLTNRMSEVELVDAGYLPIKYGSLPNRRYYTTTEKREAVDNVYTITYTPVEKSVADVQKLLLKDISGSFKAFGKRPVVDTGLGFNVDGGLDDLQRFEIGKELEVGVMMDKDGISHDVSADDYDAVILAIKTYGLKLYQTKWVREAEVKAFSTIVECMAYEKTPYTVSELIVDDNGDAVLDADGNEQYQDVVHYKNQCKEW